MMNRTVKLVLALVLAVLMAGSFTLFVIAITHPSAKYDPGKVKLDVKLMTPEELMTCAYKVYGDDTQRWWVAKTIVKNVGDVPVYNLKIQYRVSEYSEWTSGKAYPEIWPGETVRDFCWPVLDRDKVAQITTKTPVELIMKYKYKGQKEPVSQHEKIYLLGRNDFVFSTLKREDQISYLDEEDNYPFLAAFVTPNEDTTKRFAQACTAGMTPKSSDEDAEEALGIIFEGVRLF